MLYFVYSVAAPVLMPDQGQLFDVPGEAVVSGWGTLSSGGSSPDELYAVTVPLVSDDGKEAESLQGKNRHSMTQSNITYIVSY